MSVEVSENIGGGGGGNEGRNDREIIPARANAALNNPAEHKHAQEQLQEHEQQSARGDSWGFGAPSFGAGNNPKLTAIRYHAKKIIANGQFGNVILATVGETDELVAIKKIKKVRKYKGRELQILKQLQMVPHPYIITMKNYFTTAGSGFGNSDVFVNMVLEYLPETIYSLVKYYNETSNPFPLFYIQVYAYQLARALAHIHGLGICHRDVKPQNLLVDPLAMKLKLCDFSSAKLLHPDQPNQAYICSRYYRAPELIFGSTQYTIAVDIWSFGCVFVEMLTGHPLFLANSGVEHLYEVMKILGTPTAEHIADMSLKEGQELNLNHLSPLPFKSFFRIGTPDSAVQLASQMIQYMPSKRPKAIEVVAHKFFDNLRDVKICDKCKFLKGEKLPVDMFMLTNEEISLNYDIVDSILTPDLLILYHNKTPPPEEVKEEVEEEAVIEAEPLPDVNYDDFNFGGGDDNEEEEGEEGGGAAGGGGEGG